MHLLVDINFYANDSNMKLELIDRYINLLSTF